MEIFENVEYEYDIIDNVIFYLLQLELGVEAVSDTFNGPPDVSLRKPGVARKRKCQP